MSEIRVLDAETIDKIAAGEVVERPASVVKELVENAVDAGADAITVEIREGGISLIRITDNGSGMEASQIRTAFLRHATSKIQRAEDLGRISSLGFRGEALSSIAAVAQVELITKTQEALTGTRMVIEGGAEKSFEEVGAPKGSTFVVRNLFYNTPVRKKFLRQPATEGSYVIDLMEHLALSRPDISFKLMVGSQTRFYTSGKGDLREVIYRLYGRETAAGLIPLAFEKDGVTLAGFLGTPALNRSNRSFEIYFINGRFIRSNILAKAIEEGCREQLMQHKFPFCVLHMKVADCSRVDVNVHPTKMEVRFSDGMGISALVTEAVSQTLRQREMIPQVEAPLPALKMPESRGRKQGEAPGRTDAGNQAAESRVPAGGQMPGGNQMFVGGQVPKGEQTSAGGQPDVSGPEKGNAKIAGTSVKTAGTAAKHPSAPEPFEERRMGQYRVAQELQYQARQRQEGEFQQGNLFEERILTLEKRAEYRLIGQVFDTYWLIEYRDKLLIIDQHAAHEKVKYESFMKQYREKAILTQNLLPPIIVSLTGQEELAYREYSASFQALGFEVEPFGGNEYALRGVPTDLHGCGEKELFLEVLDHLAEKGPAGGDQAAQEKIASMACKAAVKGNQTLSREEAEELIDQLLTLENPYHCPHGRPTILSMSKYEMEKKFKR